MPVILAVVGGVAVGKGIQSAVRANRAKKEIEQLKKGLKDPSAELSPETMQTYGQINRMGMDRQMPGMTNVQNQRNIDASATLGNIGQMGNAQDAQAAVMAMQQQNMSAQQNDAYQNANYLADQQQNKIKGLMQMSPQIAAERQNVYEQNELNPFLRTSAAISALREKRYQESNNTFDAFAKAGQAGGQLGSAAGGFSNIGDYSSPA